MKQWSVAQSWRSLGHNEFESHIYSNGHHLLLLRGGEISPTHAGAARRCSVVDDKRGCRRRRHLVVGVCVVKESYVVDERRR